MRIPPWMVACGAVIMLTLGVGRAATITWINTAGGNWSSAANWNPNQVPGAADDVLITSGGGYTVTEDVSATVNSLTMSSGGGFVVSSNMTFRTVGGLALSSGTINIAGALNGSGLNFTGGSITGTGWLSLSGTNTWSGGMLNGIASVTVLGGGTLTIVGGNDHDLPGVTLTNQGTVVRTGGRLRGGYNSTLNNAGLWLEQSDYDLNNDYGNGITTFVNSGTFRKAGGTGNTTFQGAVQLVSSGLVDVQSGNVVFNGGGTNSGAFNAASNSACNFNSSFSFGSGSAFTGAGANLLNTGPQTFNGEITSTNLQWVAGVIAGTLTLSNGSTLYIVSANDHDLPGVTLTNHGTVIRTGGRVRGGYNAVINNAGLWLEQSDYDFNDDYYNGITTFFNSGTFRKTGGTGNTTWQGAVQLINNGLVDVQSGSAVLNGGGANRGTFNVVSNTSACTFNQGYTFNDGTRFTGAGTAVWSGGTMVVDGNFACVNLTVAGATVTGTNLFNGTVTWSSGVLSGGFTTIPANNAWYIASGADHDLPGLTLTNNGTIIRTGGRVRGGYNAVIRNAGLWLDQADYEFNNDYGNGPSTFANTGTFRKTAGPGATTFQGGMPFNNTGLVDVQSGSVVFNGGGSNSGTFNVATGTACNFQADYTFNTGTAFTGPGSVHLSGGNITFNGTVTSANLIWAGAHIVGGGTITLNGTNTWTSGVFNNSGPTVIPSGSVLYITGGADHDMPGMTWTNNGTIIHTGGRIRGGGGTVINNNGLWLEEADYDFNNDYGGAASAFVNDGTFRKLIATNTTTFQGAFAFNNNRLADVESGAVLFNGSGGGGGTFNAASNAAFNFNSSYAFNDGSTFVGPGANLLSAGTMTFNGGIVSSNLQWIAAQFAGTLTIPAGSTLFVVSGNDHNLPGLLLTNQGTILHTGGRVRGGGGTVIDNAALWLEEVDSDLNNDFGGAATVFLNNGMFRKTNSVNTTTFQGAVLLDNKSLMDVQTGTLLVNGGGDNTGTFNVASNAACNFNSSYTFEAGSLFSGPGPSLLLGGVATFNGGVGAENLQWIASQLAGTLSLSNGSTLTIASGNDHNMPGATLNNNGTVIRTGGRVRGGSGAVISNNGSWVEQVDNVFNNDLGGAASTFINYGTFLKTAGTGTTTFLGGQNFDNRGTVDVESGTVAFTAAYTQTNGTLRFGAGSLASYGQVSFPGNVGLEGTLILAFLNGFVPTNGSVLAPVVYGSRAGIFGSVVLPPLAGGSDWQVSYGSGSVLLQVVGAESTDTLKLSGSVTDAQGHPIAGVGVQAVVDPASATNLIQNGSFEAPSNGNASYQLYGVGSTNIPDWLVVGPANDNIAIHGPFLGPAEDGVQYFDPTGTTGGGGILQTFPTVAGRSYELIFFHGTSNRRGLTNALGVTLGTNTYVLGETDGGGGNLRWAEEQIPFTATSNLTTVSFHDLTGGNSDDNFVDNVQVLPADSGRVLSTVTDANGSYQIAVASGSWQVSVNGLRALGYNDVAHQTVALNDANTQVNFVTTPFAGQTFTVTTAVSPAGSGSVSGAGTYAGGSSVTVSVAATNAPYLFVSWMENGFVQSTNPTYTFTLSRNRQLVADFILPTYQVTASNSPPAAGSVAGTGSYFYGTTNVLLTTPAFGYSFANWTAGGVLLGTNPSLTVVVYSNEFLVANYAAANLLHTVTTATLPAGLAPVSGAGAYTNGQIGQFAAPASVTNGPSIYLFSRFTFNGTPVGTSPVYSKTFSTVDPTNVALVAEYAGQSIAPVVVGSAGSVPNPVGARTNFVLTLQFDRTMSRSVEPLVALSNLIAGGSSPTIATGGVWSTTRLTDDTYLTPAITVLRGMDGTDLVWVARAQDPNGRTLAPTNVLMVVIDATPPVINGISAVPSLVSAVVSWTTDEGASGQVDFGTSTNYGTNTPLATELVTLHALTLTGLAASTTYHYRVRSRDLAGNERLSGDQTFTTARDVTPPVTQVTEGPQNGQRVCALPVIFAWTGSDDATPSSQLLYAYQLDGQSWSSYGPATTVAYTNLAPGAHVFAVKARDLAGNEQSPATTISLTYDPAAPVISGVGATVGQAQAVVTWTTDKPGTSAVEYGVTAAYGTSTPLDSRLSTNHSYTVTALTPNATYHFRVHSLDACGHESVSVDATFKTAPAPDLQVVNLLVLPSTNLPSGATVTLRWIDTNSGIGSTTGPWYDQVVVSNLTSGAQLVDASVLYDADSRGNLAGGDSRTNEYSFRLPDGPEGVGPLVIWVTTDFYNNQPEQNAGGTGESNNTALANANATLAAYPDLVISNLMVNPAGLQSGMTVTLSWQDLNAGPGNVSGAFADRVVVLNLTTGDTLLDTVLPYDASADGAGPIAGGRAVNRQTTFRLPDGLAGVGAIELDVVTDSGETVFEYNSAGTAESNNTAALRVSSGLAPYPDLAVENIVVPAGGVSGQPVQISWTVSNLGTAPATGPWLDQVYLANNPAGDNPQLLAAFPYPGVLGANQSLVRTQAVVLPAFGSGSRWVVVNADGPGAVFELNKANNLAVSAQPINVPPTLALNLSSTAVPENANNPALTATVSRNTGTGTPLTVAIAASNTNKVVVPPMVVIAAGQASVSFPANVIDDGVVDGDQVVVLTATAPGFAPVTHVVTVTEADAPALTLQIPVSAIRENAGPGAAVGYITRNTATNLPLVVSLANSDTRRLSLPATVTIPAGAKSSSFDLTPIEDNVPGSTVPVTVNATATGLQGASVVVTILDSDVPMLQVSLAETNVSSGATNPATVGTVTRSPVTAYPVTVILQTSDPTTATVPATVTLAANQASATFPVNVVPNDLVTGTRVVQINAFPSDNAFNTQIDQGAGAATLAVTDDKQPSLEVAIAATIVGRNGSTTGTVSRNTAPTNNLVVTLSSSDTSQAQVPTTVTIPTGQASATFTISSVTNIPAGSMSPVTITASASGYNFGQRSFNVSDIQLPDLLVGNLSAAPVAVAGGTIPVTWTVRNNGIAVAASPWIDRVFISSSSDGSNPQPLADFVRQDDLPVGGSYSNTLTVTLPDLVGTNYLVVTTDVQGLVNDAAPQNNTRVAALPLVIGPPYRVKVVADTHTALAGTPISLHGMAYDPLTGQAVPSVPVTVRVLVKGTRRVISAETDATGVFQTYFQPLPNEAGHFTVAADYPAVTDDTAQDAFDLLGFTFALNNLAFTPMPNTVMTTEVELDNASEVPLTALTAVAQNVPDYLTITPTLTNTLPPGGSAVLGLAVTVGNVPYPRQARPVIQVTSAEGVTNYLHLSLTITPPSATLAANPGFLQAGMTRGTNKFVEFTLANIGGAASGAIAVIAPLAPWLSVVTPTNMASLDPGQSAKVTLSLHPAPDLPLSQYSGSVVFVAQQTHLEVPFQFRALASATGDLKVEVQDDYTFYVAGAPLVTNATVTLSDPYSGATVVSGITDAGGTRVFTNLLEGTYQLDVTADHHNSVRSTVTVVAGTQTDIKPFLDRQTVTYHWSVVPTAVQDTYQVVLQAVFETEVPIPVVTIDNPLLMPIVVEDEDTQIDIKVTNHGLIAAELVSFVMPDDPNYDFVPLVGVIDSLPAQSSMTIPVIVRHKTAVPTSMAAVSSSSHQGLSKTRGKDTQVTLPDCGQTITGCQVIPKITVKWSFVCGPDRHWHAAETQIVGSCVKRECWNDIKKKFKGYFDKINKDGKDPKDLSNWKDLAKADVKDTGAVCKLADSLSGCIKDECLITIMKMVCGVLTEDVKGAVQAALRFGQCWCPNLPSISIPITTAPCRNCGGGGGGGPGGCVDCPPPIIDIPPPQWDIPTCRPGWNYGGQNGYDLPASESSKRRRPRAASDSQGQAGVCARVTMQIDQRVAITRSAFLGTLVIDNGESANALTNVQVTLDIRDNDQNAANTLFDIRGPQLNGLTAVDGSGVLAASSSGSAKFTFIPTHDAATNGPTVYHIGGTLSYYDGTNLVTVPLLADAITVLPDPVLHLHYFLQRDVFGDDPFTPQIEPSEPFYLGLLVQNTGMGAAKSFQVTSSQPTIVDNQKGLLIDFKITGTRVGDQPQTPSLTANLGEIDPGQSRVALWTMLSSLQGKFLSYNATFQHIDDRGDLRTSLIDSVDIHQLIHVVRTDRPGDDDVADFLVNDIPNPDNLPDTLYLSDGTIQSVALATGAAADGAAAPGHLQVHVTATLGASWNYLQMPDPGPGLQLTRVVRSDGKELRVGDNVWTTDRSFPSSQAGAVYENLLHLFDFGGTGAYTFYYRVVESTPTLVAAINGVAPVQTGPVSSANVVFSGPIDATTFDSRALTLTRNGGANLIAPNSITISLVSNATYAVSGLSPVTGADGNYQLTVDGSQIQDAGGNSVSNAVTINWAKGTGAPVVTSLQAVSPSPRNVPVASINVAFSKPVNAATFGLGAVSLTLNGGPNLVNHAVIITPLSATNFTIGGLGSLTTADGDYGLTVSAASVQDASGNPGIGSLSETWTMITSGPRLTSLEQVATNPRNTVVEKLDVTFSEPIDPTTFDYRAITLTRNGGPNLITSDVGVRQDNPTTYSITNFNWVVGDAGAYTLTVDASGVRDLAGNSGSGAMSASWSMMTTPPSAPTNLAIVSSLGVALTNGLANVPSVTLIGNLAATNLTVRVIDQTAGIDLGTAVVRGTNFSLPITFAVAGKHTLAAHATDPAGNDSTTVTLDVFIDFAPPVATLQAIAPNPRSTSVSTIDVTFSKAIVESTFDTHALQLARSGLTNNLITAGVNLLYVSGTTYRITGLDALTAAPGLYQLTVSLAGIRDLAGNAGSGFATETWQVTASNTPPVLAAIPNQVIAPESLLILTNSASDADTPRQTLTFSLAPGAPAGMEIDPPTGLLLWVPTLSQAPSTNVVTVMVTDSGVPSASASQSFTVIVSSYVTLTAGSALVPTGQNGTLPVSLLSPATVTNLGFAVKTLPGYLTNTTWSAGAGVGNLRARPLSDGLWVISLSAPAGGSLQGTQLVAQLNFTVISNRPSAFLPVALSGLSALQSNGAAMTNLFPQNGRIVALGAEPLLDAVLSSNRLPVLTLYGTPGSTNGVDAAPAPGTTVNWTELLRVTLTNTSQVLGEAPSTNPATFYRARKF